MSAGFTITAIFKKGYKSVPAHFCKHDWAKGINVRGQTNVILLDFFKTFDSVPTRDHSLA